MDITQYISINPEIRFGKPCLLNTRIAVGDVLLWLASGMSYDEIIEDFPEVTQEHILASLFFAARRENMVKTIIDDQTAA